MKKITELLTALVICSLMIFVSCGPKKGDDGASTDAADEVGAVLATISGSPSSVTLDGADRDEWDATTFTVTYDSETNGGTIAIANAPTNEGAEDVWGNGGNYTLSDDGTTANYGGTTIAISGKTLTFDVADPSGRVASFYGKWVFSF
jgi:hypothetical protein